MKREHAQCLLLVGILTAGLGGLVGLLMLFAYLNDHGVSAVALSCIFLGIMGSLLLMCTFCPVKNERVMLDTYTPPAHVTVLHIPAKANDPNTQITA